jgi:hypothetical protein
MPRLVDRLTALPEDREVHIHLRALLYIDHACFDAIAEWERKRSDKGYAVVVEWQDAKDRYFRTNDFGRLAKAREPEPHFGAGPAH